VTVVSRDIPVQGCCWRGLLLSLAVLAVSAPVRAAATRSGTKDANGVRVAACLDGSDPTCVLPAARRGAELRPRESDAAGSAHAVALSGNGAILPASAVALSATSLTFADRTIGTASASQLVTVTNSGNAPLRVGFVTLAGANAPDFTAAGCAGLTLLPGESCSIGVTFTPSAVGARSAGLSIASDAAASPHTVALSGNGIATPPGAAGLVAAYSFDAGAGMVLKDASWTTGPLRRRHALDAAAIRADMAGAVGL
jgi:hypothetical protein